MASYEGDETSAATERILVWLIDSEEWKIYSESAWHRTIICACPRQHVLAVARVAVTSAAAQDLVRRLRDCPCVGEVPDQLVPIQP
jgi:hypothetical protein